ncbi:hypothetical protein [Neobacillus jeddahensis]|uniref:hypothetical protein n=1 Tax=Neobacillus jeddahensis TaxID=1461580 RepID=UPI000A8B78A0|nr:hypothetical protein [Neobacillus jeddahensis]
MSQSSSPLKLGKEMYGIEKLETAFLKAFEFYFGRSNTMNIKNNNLPPTLKKRKIE